MIRVDCDKLKVIDKSDRFERLKLNLTVKSDLKLFDEIIFHFYQIVTLASYFFIILYNL